jgi:hypothetical protein
MKKSIFIAVLGVTASVASSYGQGFVAFNSYVANQSVGAIAWAADGTTPLDGYTADLYFALGTVSDPGHNDSTLPSAAFTDLHITGVTYSGGYFQGPTAIIPGYASGPITFEVVAFNGTSITDPTTTFRGRSGSFTESSIANSASSPLTIFGDNGTGLPVFAVAPVPEPTTLALAGLGGLASLVAFRRKQA